MPTASYKADEIAAYLHHREHATRDAANRAGRMIATAWNNREFWLSATLTPLDACAGASPDMPPAREVLARLQLRFGTHVHDCPGWEPPPPAPAIHHLAPFLLPTALPNSERAA